EYRHDSVYNGPMVTIDLGDGEIAATAYHPFWVIRGENLADRSPPEHIDANEDRGGALAGRWVNSHDLRVGDVVFLRTHRPVTVRRVGQHNDQRPVCNLTIRGLHTFAVGEMQVLVHNTSASGGPPNGGKPDRMSPGNLEKARELSRKIENQKKRIERWRAL